VRIRFRKGNGLPINVEVELTGLSARSFPMSDRLSRRRFVTRTAGVAGVVTAGLHAPVAVKAATSNKWGDLVGRFVYDGDPPERKKLIVDKDVDCCGKFDIRDESLMVGEDHGLGNVYIYVRSSRSRPVDICSELEETSQKRVLLDNRDCIFMPHCMKIWHTRQEYYIVNSDPIAQNVAFSPLLDLPANIVLPAAPGPGTDVTWKFGRAQRIPVPVKCNYHPWESAYVLPLDHPYVDFSKMDGTFRIPKLPIGQLEFQVWHERVGYLDIPQLPKGRFEMTIHGGVNDLGTISLNPSLFEV
jgi:hypothetical protein